MRDLDFWRIAPTTTCTMYPRYARPIYCSRHIEERLTVIVFLKTRLGLDLFDFAHI